MSTVMSRAEREAFLAETRIGVVAVADGERGPLAVPIWYAYEPGGVIRFVTGATSRKMKLIEGAGRLSFCVQSEQLPYRWVQVEGPAAISEPDYERDVRSMALRYLGADAGQKFLDSFADVHAEAQRLVTVTPERWASYDSSKEGL